MASVSDAELDAQELKTLSGVELGALLNEIDKQIPPLINAANDADEALAKAETILVYLPDDRDARAARILHKSTLKVLDRNLKALRNRQSRIQSLIRTIV